MSYAYFVRFNGQLWFLPFLFHWLMTQVCTHSFLTPTHNELLSPSLSPPFPLSFTPSVLLTSLSLSVGQLQHAMIFFVNHCELPLEGLQLRIFLGPNQHVFIRQPIPLIPPPAGAQPDRLNDQGPPPPVVAQPNVHQEAPPPRFDVVAGDQPAAVPPPVNNDEIDARNNAGPQEIVLPSGTAPDSLRRRVVGVASQSRVESQARGGSMFVEESRSDEGHSEFVSGSSTRSIFTSDTTPRYPGYTSSVGPRLSDSRLLERSGERVLSRDSIRAARVNRFHRTSFEGDSDWPNIDNHTQ